MSQKLPREFYERPTLTVAAELLGKILVFDQRPRTSGRIVEVEAYVGESDPACHARFGPTQRNRVMYGPGGFSYVYFVYGMYDMLNFVTEQKGFPAACLIRGLEPLEGIKAMQKRRRVVRIECLTNGPGKLCRAFGLTTSHSGLDLTDSKLYVVDDGFRCERIGRSARIGIREGADREWRFFVEGNRYVSRTGG